MEEGGRKESEPLGLAGSNASGSVDGKLLPQSFLISVMFQITFWAMGC